MGIQAQCSLPNMQSSGSLNLRMKFTERLNIAIRRGLVQKVNGKLYVPTTCDMRRIFPGLKTSRYATVKRAFWRHGYVLRHGLWEYKHA